MLDVVAWAAFVIAVGTFSPVEGDFYATHYGESYNNQTMGCEDAGYYSSDNPTILAVSPERYTEWPCGTILKLTYPHSRQSVTVVRQDSCPGCSAYVLDLSEAALWELCQWHCNVISGVQVDLVKLPE